MQDFFIVTPPPDTSLWEVVSDVGFEPEISSPSDLELVPILKGREQFITHHELLARAQGELQANLGQAHLELVLQNQAEIPVEFRKFFLVFPGTIWRSPERERYIYDLRWHAVAGEWQMFFHWLDLLMVWNHNDMLLRPRNS